MTVRRDFLKTGLLAGGFLGLQRALGAPNAKGARVDRVASGYGPLMRDPENLLDLPEGFRYRVLSRCGEKMSDGYLVPGKADGMAAFEGEDGRVILVRNHELGVEFANLSALPNAKECPEGMPCYDAGEEGEFVDPGGTTHLIYNPATGEVEREFLSLIGTDKNCAGGPTPWGSWITCEEPQFLTEGRGAKHGWCFEVQANTEGVQDPVLLRGLGRFRHEAIAVNPATGVVFLTEDRHESLFYRFIPEVKGDLTKGGKLQALALQGQETSDSRNWNGQTFPEGKGLSIEWIDLEDTDAPKDDLRIRGAKAGGTLFARGEGCWWGEGEVWFCCTNGGPEQRGQLFRLKPDGDGGELELFLEPKKSDLLTNGDNLTVADNGDIIIAEDRIVNGICSLRGVTSEGKIYTLARNRFNKSELAGVCFSPDGKTLFVNIQNPGITLAIEGDWEGRRL